MLFPVLNWFKGHMKRACYAAAPPNRNQASSVPFHNPLFVRRLDSSELTPVPTTSARGCSSTRYPTKLKRLGHRSALTSELGFIAAQSFRLFLGCIHWQAQPVHPGTHGTDGPCKFGGATWKPYKSQSSRFSPQPSCWFPS